MALSSYQRRKQNIAYLLQVVNERTSLCCAIVGYAKKDGFDVKIPLVGKGITGDSFLTDMNDFSMYLSTASADALIEKSHG